jgi:hypothetical protein
MGKDFPGNGNSGLGAVLSVEKRCPAMHFIHVCNRGRFFLPVFSRPMRLACTSFKKTGNILTKILTTFLYDSKKWLDLLH